MSRTAPAGLDLPARTGQAGVTGFRRSLAALSSVQPADPSRSCLLIALLPTALSPRPGLTLPGAVGVGLAANAVILAVLLAGYALFLRFRRG